MHTWSHSLQGYTPSSFSIFWFINFSIFPGSLLLVQKYVIFTILTQNNENHSLDLNFHANSCPTFLLSFTEKLHARVVYIRSLQVSSSKVSSSLKWSLFSTLLKWSESCSVISESLQPHGLNSPWNFPDQNTGVGSLPFSRGSSQSRDQTQVSLIAGRFFTSLATREALPVTCS